MPNPLKNASLDGTSRPNRAQGQAVCRPEAFRCLYDEIEIGGNHGGIVQIQIGQADANQK
jgi:hypothetical protein